MEENGACWIGRSGRREKQGASIEGVDPAMAGACWREEGGRRGALLAACRGQQREDEDPAAAA
jgi:hypothetical protein